MSKHKTKRRSAPTKGYKAPASKSTILKEPEFEYSRLPKALQASLKGIYDEAPITGIDYLKVDALHHGDSRTMLSRIQKNSVALSVWSPPYFVGKSYERNMTFDDWQALLRDVIKAHFPILSPGGFLAINIADILCFKDEDMPRIQADVQHRKKISLTKEDILEAIRRKPRMSRYELAAHFQCSEQTIDRRLNGNNIRGGKHQTQTRVKMVGGLIEQWALEAGLYPYDRRIWVKDAAWENSRWASLSYRAVDEFEYIYIFWKPGITKFDRSRLVSDEWKNWGSRGVWSFPSVRANDDHEAKFPLELPTRLIKLFTEPGDVVLDCFMGSGTSAVAAIREQRRYIGVELDRSYWQLSVKRVADEMSLFRNANTNAN